MPLTKEQLIIYLFKYGITRKQTVDKIWDALQKEGLQIFKTN